MKLIFVRHGQAGPYCADDAGRVLTQFGQAQADETARYITDHHKVDLIIASPYVRADQTAKILLDKLNQAGQTPQFLTLDIITPDDDPVVGVDGIDTLIRQQFGDDAEPCVAIVCHMPIVAYMVAHLDGLLPSSFELAECRVLQTAVIAEGLGHTCDRFVPKQP